MVNRLAYLSLPNTVVLLHRQAMDNLRSLILRGLKLCFSDVLTFGGRKLKRQCYESIGAKAAPFILHVVM